MSSRVRHPSARPVPALLAGLWAVLLLLTGATAQAHAAPVEPVGVASFAPATGSAHQPNATVRPYGARPRAPYGTTYDRTLHNGSEHAYVAAQHPRLPGLPGQLPGASGAPHTSPLGQGRAVGPRQERAPPLAWYLSRSTRGPPGTRSS